MTFDEKAATWDDNPQRRERAEVAAREILVDVAPGPGAVGLEFGCGTGLLSFCLADRFERMFLVDSSPEMIRVMADKAAAQGLASMTPVLGSADRLGTGPASVDVVYTLMALHHVRDLDPAFAAFRSVLKPGGALAVVDLVAEDGAFHKNEAGFDGHNGFSYRELRDSLGFHGFGAFQYREIYGVKREVDGVVRTYPLFLLTCRKS